MMQRREFIEAMAQAATAGMLGACTPLAGRPDGRAATASACPPLDLSGIRASRHFAEMRFGRIAYVDCGSGDAVLFLHGFPLNSFQWRGAIDRLSMNRRCIAPDFMGLGYTEVADGQGVGPDAQAAMLVELLDHLRIASVDLVANDSGGAVAQLFVTRYPELARSLLLTNCDAEIDSPPPALLPVIELAKSGQFVDRWLARWLADKELARSAKGIGGMCYAQEGHPTDEAIECYFAPLVSSPRQKALVHQYTIALERNPLAGIEAALKRCRIPVRIVWGTADTIFSKESPHYLDRSFGNSRGVRTLEGSKLFWPEERPDVIADEALRLWRAESTSPRFQ